MVRNVSRFFNADEKFYGTYLKSTDQKETIAKIIYPVIERMHKKQIRILSIGGGSGEGDLGVISRLSKPKLAGISINYIDPSITMYSKFIKNAKALGIVDKVEDVEIKKFESTFSEQKNADVILVLNSLYFIKGWIKGKKNNPLKKIYSLINPGGFCAIVIRSAKSEHTKLKRLAGGGKMTGDLLKASLNRVKISFYTESAKSKIDVTKCFDKNLKFVESEHTNKLFSFIFGDRWKTMDKKRRNKIINEVSRFAISEGKHRYINSEYEIIWIRKSQADPNYKIETRALPSKRLLSAKLRKSIKTYDNFPASGVKFRDTTRVLRDKKLFNEVINYICNFYKPRNIDFCVAKDMQALIWAGAIAHQLNCGIVPMFRKDLPGDIITATYEHEYNKNRVINLQKDSIKPGQKVLLIDYIMATGETMYNMANMVEHLGGVIVGIFCVIELTYLNPRKKLEKYDIETLVKY